MKKIFLLAMLFIAGLIPVLAQQTAYEKKVAEISKKYYCYGKYGYNGGLTMEDEFTIAMFGAKEAAALMLVNYAMNYDDRIAGKWMENFERELENAKSLMTDVDFYKLFLKTSYGQAMTQVKEGFDKKFAKDEFETQSQFQARVKADAAIEFDRLCSKLLAYMNSTLHITVSPKSYDAENGAYKVEIEEEFKISDNNNIKSSYETWLPMQPDVARQYQGEVIKPESMTSIEWVNDDDEIHAQQIAYIDDSNVTRTYIADYNTAKLLVFDYDKLMETNPLLPGHVWKSSDLKNYYETYAKILNAAIDEYNQKITADKYYDKTRASNYLLASTNYPLADADKYDEHALQNTVDRLEISMQTDYAKALEKMAKDCRKNNPDKFIDIFKAEHPDFESKVAKLELDYRCYNWSHNKLAFYVIDDIMPNENKCYDEYIELFNNEEEFDSFYTNVAKFNQEVNRRKVIQKEYFALINRIPQERNAVMGNALQTGKLSEIYATGKKISVSFKGAKDGKDANALEYINAIERFKIIDAWYDNALDMYFKIDAKMAKEYGKVGLLFNNKKEFFEAYISPDYKKILKSKK